MFAYKRQGRAEPASGYLLPNRPVDLWAWLTANVGALEWLTVDGVLVPSPGESIALDSPADMAAAWPARWATAAAARDWRVRNGGMTLLGASVRFRYQRAGRNQKWRTGAYDPAVVPGIWGWLNSRLGELAGFNLIETAAQAADAQPMPPAARRFSPRVAPVTVTFPPRAAMRPRGRHFRAPLSPTAAAFF